MKGKCAFLFHDMFPFAVVFFVGRCLGAAALTFLFSAGASPRPTGHVFFAKHTTLSTWVGRQKVSKWSKNGGCNTLKSHFRDQRVYFSLLGLDCFFYLVAKRYC